MLASCLVRASRRLLWVAQAMSDCRMKTAYLKGWRQSASDLSAEHVGMGIETQHDNL
jgi:hypothetical protein